jgi:HEAT repeat protein
MRLDSEKKIKQIETLQQIATEASIQKIIDFIEENDLAVKLTAIEVLGELPKSEKIKQKLLQLAENTDEEVRYYALESLKGYTGKDILNCVAKKVDDSDDLVRISAVETLGNLGYKEGIDFLFKALLDSDEIVRSYAAESLGKIGTIDLIPDLEKLLQDEKSSISKLGFYLALYHLGVKKYLHLILKLLNDPSYRVRCAVANSLGILTDKDNINHIKENLLFALKQEKTVAARTSLRRALEEINRHK